VCFFTLESFLNWNLKGVVYVFGLLFACFINVGISNAFGIRPPVSETTNVCVSFSLGNGTSQLSGLPLSTAVFSYTFFYLLTFIIFMGYNGYQLDLKTNRYTKAGTTTTLSFAEFNRNMSNAMSTSIPTLILFPLLMILDFVWNAAFGCSDWMPMLLSIVISGLIAASWASIIASSGNKDLQYISSSLGNVCSKPTTTMFRCKTRNATTDSTKIASSDELNKQLE
jgi:hypothetical protein